jgi:hypothetical protein
MVVEPKRATRIVPTGSALGPDPERPTFKAQAIRVFLNCFTSVTSFNIQCQIIKAVLAFPLTANDIVPETVTDINNLHKLANKSNKFDPSLVQQLLLKADTASHTLNIAKNLNRAPNKIFWRIWMEENMSAHSRKGFSEDDIEEVRLTSQTQQTSFNYIH